MGTSSILIFLLVTLCSIYKTFSQEICTQKCEASYPLHTVDKVGELQACTKGCRIQMISHLSGKEQDCAVDCNSAYVKDTDGEKQACILGCQEEKQLLNKLPKKFEIEVEDTSNVVFQFYIFHPFYLARNHYRNLFNGRGERAQPSFYVEEASTDGQGNSIFRRVEIYPNVNVRSSARQVSIEGNQDPPSTVKRYAHKIHRTASQWLNCVEVKAGVPYATLVTVLFFCLFMVAWICCAACDDEIDEPKEKRHKFSNVGTSIMADQLLLEERDGAKVFTISPSSDKERTGFKVFKPKIIGKPSTGFKVFSSKVLGMD